eukprot:918887-Prymnesium_polylepis.3
MQLITSRCRLFGRRSEHAFSVRSKALAHALCVGVVKRQQCELTVGQRPERDAVLAPLCENAVADTHDQHAFGAEAQSFARAARAACEDSCALAGQRSHPICHCIGPT